MKKLSFCLLAGSVLMLSGCVVEETTYVETSRPYYHPRPVRHTHTTERVYYSTPQTTSSSSVSVHYDKRSKHHHDRSRHGGYQVQPNQPSYPTDGYSAQPNNGGYGVGGSGSGYHTGGQGGYHVPSNTPPAPGGYQSQSSNQSAGGYQSQPASPAAAPRKHTGGMFRATAQAAAQEEQRVAQAAAQAQAAAPAGAMTTQPDVAPPAPVMTAQEPAPAMTAQTSAPTVVADAAAPLSEEKKDEAKPADVV